MSVDDFLALVTAGQPAAPDYFVYDAVLNRKQHAVLDGDAALTPLRIGDVLACQQAPPVVIDVRDAGGLARGAIVHAHHIPLAQLPHRLGEIPTGRPVVAYCAGGYRSSVAASLLRREGLTDV